MGALPHHTRPWTRRLLQLLEQAPRPREWLIAEVAGLVPPGIAWRYRERSRLKNARRHGYSWREDVPDEEKIRTGRRAIVMHHLSALTIAGRIARYEEDGVVMLRIARRRMTKRELARAYDRTRQASIARWRAMTPEQREVALRHLRMTDIQRSEASRRGWVTRKERENATTQK